MWIRKAFFVVRAGFFLLPFIPQTKDSLAVSLISSK